MTIGLFHFLFNLYLIFFFNINIIREVYRGFTLQLLQENIPFLTAMCSGKKTLKIKFSGKRTK